MNPPRLLKDEIAFLLKQLPELESRSDLGHVAVEFKKQIDAIRKQSQDLEPNV
jgi:hypothetical protein